MVKGARMARDPSQPKEGRIDERYAAIYQRGGDASGQSSQSGGPWPGARNTGSGRIRSGSIPSGAPAGGSYAAPIIEVAAAGSADPANTEDVAGGVSPEDPVVTRDSKPPSRQPRMAPSGMAPSGMAPSIIALWTIGIGLTLLGIFCLFATELFPQAMIYHMGPQDAFPAPPWPLRVGAATQPLLTVGLGSIAGLLFLRAARRR